MISLIVILSVLYLRGDLGALVQEAAGIDVMGVRDVITVSALIFGICSWAVLLGGLATVHGTIADSAKTLEEFNTFSFSWFLVCGFLWSWVVTMVCYLVGIMPSAAKFMTPILSILIAWFGVEIQKVLAWVLKVQHSIFLLTKCQTQVVAAMPLL